MDTQRTVDPMDMGERAMLWMSLAAIMHNTNHSESIFVMLMTTCLAAMGLLAWIQQTCEMLLRWKKTSAARHTEGE